MNQKLRVRLPIAAVAKRYGVHPKTIERWADDPATGFPKAIYVRRRRYFNSDELADWDCTYDHQPGGLRQSAEAEEPPSPISAAPNLNLKTGRDDNLLTHKDLGALGISWSAKKINQLCVLGLFPKPMRFAPRAAVQATWRRSDLEAFLEIWAPRTLFDDDK